MIRDQFNSWFGYMPRQIARAPGRVNLIGEHVDYNGGTVLPTAIDRHVTVALRSNDLTTHRIHSTQFDGLVEYNMQFNRRGDWTDYVAGALDVGVKRGLISAPVDIAIDSDVPSGVGLSSSAALITAILRGLCKLNGKRKDAVELAKDARLVENKYVGVPCGLMDQMAVGLASSKQALAFDTYEDSYELIDISSEFSFLTINSGIKRKLTDGRYKERFDECLRAANQLGADHLCRLGDQQNSRLSGLSENLQARTRHVVSEHRRALSAITCLRASDVEGFGALMNESHTSYAEDFMASTPEIDALVGSALSAGAIGARLTGGGFGGCIIVLVRSGDEARVCEDLRAQYPAIDVVD